MRILVLDDERAVLDTLKSILTQNDHDVDVVDNAEDALHMVGGGNYDLVLVDYKLPENDGIWFMQNVALPPQTRVLLVTAYVNRRVINRMFELGASGYLIKPFNETELLRHLSFLQAG